MPHRLSSRIDIGIMLIIVIGLLLTILYYNLLLSIAGLVLFCCLAAFIIDREKERTQALSDYYQNVVKNINELSNIALEHLPQVIMVVNQDNRLEWYNNELPKWLGINPQLGSEFHDFWPNLNLEPCWHKTGETVFQNKNRFYLIKYRPVPPHKQPAPNRMALYINDITEYEQFKRNTEAHSVLFGYIQIDNYDDALQGLSEAQRTSILFEVNNALDKWSHSLNGLLRRLDDDMYIILIEHYAYSIATAENFDILDRVRAIRGPNKFPITLSIGLVEATSGITMENLGLQAQSCLDLALGRGGDQVAVNIDGKITFFGGKTKAVEKHTRVKSRVVAHAVKEIIGESDVIFIMGHHNEDFDCLGSAIGIAAMARAMKKEVYIILSDMNEGIDKLTDVMKENPLYHDMFISPEAAEHIHAANPALFAVDLHIPHLAAGQNLLSLIKKIIVIDHHRRSEDIIKNTLLVYIESSSSSTSEIVTELLMYFSDEPAISYLEATALYAGIIVDTKNFTVQTGVRTFDAVAYLRRNGADPQFVNQLFRTDYSTNIVKAKAISNSQFFPGGLIVAVCPTGTPSIQIISAQIADQLLRIDHARMSLVFFQIDDTTVGISARSLGELNVQVLMESFGGGGHINVAGAQIKNIPLPTIKEQAIETAQAIIRKVDKAHESNS